jgi:hypothetical protein
LWYSEERNHSAFEVARFLFLSGLTFLVINLPFIVWEAKDWFLGITQPLHDTMVFFSRGGLSDLTHLGFVNLPKSYYLAATLMVLALLIFCYWRHYQTLRDVLWILPGIYMWFSYRSLESYWSYWLFPILATVSVRHTMPVFPIQVRNWQLTVKIGALTLSTLVILGAVLSLPPNIEVDIRLPLFVTGDRVTRIDVEVRNKTHSVLTPRFALQHPLASQNPLGWVINSGPSQLAAGQSAMYQISPNGSSATFRFYDFAQLVVTDAQGDYTLRGITDITPDRSILWPDAILNPTYSYWNSASNLPMHWGLRDDPPQSGSIIPVWKEGKNAVLLRLNSATEGLSRVTLYNWINLPYNKFGIWLYIDPYLENTEHIAYGIEVDDGQHKMWLLFGRRPYTGSIPPGYYVINHTIPTGGWTYQIIDLATSYRQTGWTLPDLKRTAYRGTLDIDLRMVNLSLLLASNGMMKTTEAHFGPIVQEQYEIKPQILMAETLSQPTTYYLRLATLYMGDRNYGRALEAYQRALTFSPSDLSIQQAINALKQQLIVEDSK